MFQNVRIHFIIEKNIIQFTRQREYFTVWYTYLGMNDLNCSIPHLYSSHSEVEQLPTFETQEEIFKSSTNLILKIEVGCNTNKTRK